MTDMMPFFPLTPEDEEIVLKALQFTKDKIRQYHSDWVRDAHPSNAEDIDGKRARLDKRINSVIDIITNPNAQLTLRRSSELDVIHEWIASSLKIYAKELEKAQDPNLPTSTHRFQRTSHLLNGERFGKYLLNNLWDDYYEGYNTVKKGKKRQLFFSYSSKDKKNVGKISKILKAKYNYSVFKAHDINSIDIDEKWRAEIQRNLRICDGLIAYVTRRFRFSEWTNQECGWVMARGIPIYSLLEMKSIPGFLEEKQGVRITHPINYERVAKDIHEFIVRYYSRSIFN